MVRLLKSERIFLSTHDIDEKFVFDASRCVSIADAKRQMSSLGKFLAFGFRECDSGHRIMNGRGVCMQCYPRKLSHIRGWITPGIVYLAESASSGLIKIGWCADATERQQTLNDHNYGDASDWQMRNLCYAEQPAALEHAIDQKLRAWKEVIEYYRYRKLDRTRETYRCSYRRALAVFRQLAFDEGPW